MRNMGAIMEGMMLAEQMKAVDNMTTGKPVTTGKASREYNELCIKRRAKRKAARKQRRRNRK